MVARDSAAGPLVLEPGTTDAQPRRTAVRLPRFETKQVVLLVVAAFLVYQVIVPLGFLIWGSLKTSRPTDLDYLSLQLTLANYQAALSSRTFWTATYNTLVYAVGSTFVAGLIGVYLALLIARTDAPLKGIISALAYVRIIVPGFLMAIAWILLGSPEIGAFNRLFKDLTGSTTPLFNVYTLWGMIVVQALDVFPLVFLTVTAALRSMDPTLEEAAFTAGKSVPRTLWRITFPLMRPALVASSILIFIYSVEAFEVPLAIGLPHGIYVLSTQIFFKTTQTPVDYGVAGAYGVMLLGLALGCLYVYQRVTRQSHRYMTVTGKAFRPREIALGRWGWLGSGLALLVMLFAVVFPTLILFWASLQPYLLQPSIEALQSVSLDNYRDMLASPIIAAGIKNSLVLAGAAATLVVIFVAIISWIVYRTRVPGRQALDMLAFAPQAVPSLLLAVATLWLYLVLPLPVYGTLWIVLMAYLTRFTPVAMRIVSVGMVQIHKELEEAAYVAGAAWPRTFFRVLIPLLRPVLVTAWVWIAIHAFRDVSISVVLSGPTTETVGLAIYDLLRGGFFGLLCAFSVVVLAILMVVAYLAERVGRRFGVSGLG